MITVIDLNFLGLKNANASFLIETNEGPILIETGPHSTLPHLTAGLKEKGYSMQDVKHVFVTHIHLDHAGAAWAFAEHGATIYMHPFGKKHMVEPSKLYASAKMIYKDQMETLWGSLNPIPEDQIKTLEHGEKVNIGGKEIICWHTPGHAVHHIAYQLGQSLVAGDVAGVKVYEKGMIVAPCPPPDINIDHWMTSIELIKTLDLTEVFMSHFGRVTDLEKHFKELEFVLWDWANWMRPYYDKQTPPNEITPIFMAYVRQQLIDYGVEEKYLETYEASNPSWMSVAGLLRYWKKKLKA